MKVHLRRKKISKSRISLYLEFYDSGKRQFETLGLYIHDKNRLTQLEKDHNKQILNTAEAIQSQRTVEIKNNQFGFLNRKANTSFMEYFKYTTLDKGNYHTSSYKQLYKYLKGKDISFNEVDTNLLEQFKKFLLETKSVRTTSLYINSIKICVNKALTEGIYKTNPLLNFKNIKSKHNKRTYLTIEELRLLSQTECYRPEVKNAFMFACFCGLRVSDLMKLNYKDIINNQIAIYQKKTKESLYIPLNSNCFDYIDSSKIGIDSKVFDIDSIKVNNNALRVWAKSAEIEKHITFHVARHTFATLSLSFGVDLYTVSKLLGHTDISTTQIYAKITDQLKTEAINKLPKL